MMKTLITNNIAFILCLVLLGCQSEDSNENDSKCEENTISIVENQFTNQTTGAMSYWNHTYTSVKASNNKITITIEGDITIIVENYKVTEGSQQLGGNPSGKIIDNSIPFLPYTITYTTYYQTNGQNSFPPDPNGTLIISKYNQTCNTISGSIEIQPWGFHDDGSGAGLGEIHFPIHFSFESVPLDNDIYQL